MSKRKAYIHIDKLVTLLENINEQIDEIKLILDKYDSEDSIYINDLRRIFEIAVLISTACKVNVDHQCRFMIEKLLSQQENHYKLARN